MAGIASRQSSEETPMEETMAAPESDEAGESDL